jgi:ankyrin repeat protein
MDEALARAVIISDIEAVKRILKSGVKSGVKINLYDNILFWVAPRKSNINLYNLLLKNGANIDATMKRSEHSSFNSIITYRRREKLHLLTDILEKNADIEVVKYLLKKGAIIEKYYSIEAVILRSKLSSRLLSSGNENKNAMKLIDLLIQYGANINDTEPKTGQTNIMNVYNVELAKYFIIRGANMYIKDKEGYNIFDYILDEKTIKYLKKVNLLMSAIIARKRNTQYFPKELVIKTITEYL